MLIATLSQPSSENINLLNNINQLNWQTAADKINNIGELLSKYPSNLVLHRLINQLFTSQPPEYSLSTPVSNMPKFAVVIPGELRCFESSYKFLSGLSKFAIYSFAQPMSLQIKLYHFLGTFIS